MPAGASVPSSGAPDAAWLRRLLDAGCALASQPELEAGLDRLLETAQDLTGARYAALGILDPERATLERFLTRGIDADTERRIGDRPRGRGVLGALINQPRALRLEDVTRHPMFHGFPPAHPPMRTFLGVPLLIAGQAWGNLYLAEKAGGEPFDLADEQTVGILAQWASLAIVNARLSAGVAHRTDQLDQLARTLEATTTIARAVGDVTDLPRVLELIVKRGRALLESRAMVLLLAEGEDLVLAAAAGEVVLAARGTHIAIADATSGDVLRAGRPQRIDDVQARLRISADHLGVEGARTALLAPLAFRGRDLGVLVAFDRGGGEPFREDDEQLMVGLAASAATAVATAQSVERERLARSLEAAEQERRRWARELHDETLQGLAALQVLLTSAQRRTEPEDLLAAIGQAVEQIALEIASLRTLISELRPAALDELGLEAALEALTIRVAAVSGLAIEVQIELGEATLPPEIETSAYRVLQESLNNVAKHAAAEHVQIAVNRTGDELRIEIRDDGTGFHVGQPTQGWGLTGMRERAALAGGELRIASSPSGTCVSASFPLRRGRPREEAPAGGAAG